MAFLTVLGRLAPEARAAFLLREVLDTDYDELARIIGKSEAACRQMVSRAKAIADPQAGYFGAPVDDQTLVAGDGARVGTTRFEDWLSASKSVNP